MAVATHPSEVPHEADAYAKSFGERLAVLEAHWQDARDSYVKKDQLAEAKSEFTSAIHGLRTDMHKLEVRLITWFVGTALLIFGVFYVVTNNLSADIREVRAEMQDVRSDIRAVSEQLTTLNATLQAQHLGR